MHQKIKFVDSLGLPSTSILKGKLGFWLWKLAITLRIIRRYGLLTVIVHRASTGKIEKYQGHNLIPDAGIKHIGDILIGDEVTNIRLLYMEPDSGSTDPAVGNTDTETALTPADRLAITLDTRNTVSPFEIILETFVSSTKYTRPQTIRKLAVFWGPDETGDLFAIGKLATPVTLNTNDTATLTYAFIWR